MKKIYSGIEELVGQTPLVRLKKWEKKNDLRANIIAKCEFYNPLFSIKDRASLRMLEKLEQDDKVSEDTIFVEATSGNTGIALPLFQPEHLPVYQFQSTYQNPDYGRAKPTTSTGEKPV